MIAPANRTRFQEAMDEQIKARAPAALGHNGRPLPPVDPHTVFGRANNFEGSAAECITPARTADDDKLDNATRAMYIISHNRLGPGEQRERGYTNAFQPTKAYGISTPMDIHGVQTKKAFNWVPDEEAKRKTKLITLAERQRTDKHFATVATVKDPISDTMTVSDDHTFGWVHPQDNETVETLLKSRQDEQPSTLSSSTSLCRRVQQAIASVQFTFVGVSELERLLLAADPVSTGVVSRNQLTKILEDAGLSFPQDLMIDILDSLSSDETGAVDYLEFLSLAKGNPESSNDQTFNPNRSFGIPTIRSDLVAPAEISVCDKKNYGDQGSAGICVAPNGCTRRSLDERDTMASKPRAHFEKIFNTAGLQNQGYVFSSVWAEAEAEAQNGKVTYEIFKAVLDRV